jgi:hypothetical protein
MLHDTKPRSDERRIRERSVRRRVGAGSVEIRERRGLVDEHPARQVDRQRNAGLLRDVDRALDDLFALEYTESVSAPCDFTASATMSKLCAVDSVR